MQHRKLALGAKRLIQRLSGVAPKKSPQGVEPIAASARRQGSRSQPGGVGPQASQARGAQRIQPAAGEQEQRIDQLDRARGRAAAQEPQQQRVRKKRAADEAASAGGEIFASLSAPKSLQTILRRSRARQRLDGVRPLKPGPFERMGQKMAIQSLSVLRMAPKRSARSQASQLGVDGALALASARSEQSLSPAQRHLEEPIGAIIRARRIKQALVSMAQRFGVEARRG